MNKNKYILVIEDNTSIQEALAWLLETDYKIIAALNGQEAFEIIKDNISPDLILLDIMMPIMNGLEFRQLQNNDSKLNKIPTIIVSAKQNLDLELHPNELLLAKPFNVENLLKMIKNQLSR